MYDLSVKASQIPNMGEPSVKFAIDVKTSDIVRSFKTLKWPEPDIVSPKELLAIIDRFWFVLSRVHLMFTFLDVEVKD